MSRAHGVFAARRIVMLRRQRAPGLVRETGAADDPATDEDEEFVAGV
jgi:hypothetical protein